MLCRPGKWSYLALLLILVYSWSHWRTQSGQVLHRGWEVTRERFSQGASFADDLFDQAYFSKNSPPTSIEASSTNLTSVNVSSSLALKDVSETGVATEIAPATEIVSATEIASATASAPATKSKSAAVQQQEDSPYAYVFYATQDNYACSVLVNIQRLQDVLHTRHRIFVLVSPEVSNTYVLAYEQRNATVSIQTPPSLAEGSSEYYKDCLLKLFAFKMHHIDPSLRKVISLDSDQLIIRSLDHLFEMSVDVDLAAPRAYWIARDSISSTFMLINLSERLWQTVDHAINTIKPNKYDMDLIQDTLADTVMMLPGHFVAPNSHWEDWNLPNWFYAQYTIPTVAKEPETTHTPSKAIQRPPMMSPVNKRQIVDIDTIRDARQHVDITDALATEPVTESALAKDESTQQLSATSQPNKGGLEEEQTNASSGDIFDYLDDLKKHEPETKVEESVNNSSAELPEGKASENPYTVPTVPVELKFQHVSMAELQERPLFKELYELYPAVSVLHFFGLGKPWSFTLAAVLEQRPGAHPLFVEQFRLWRQTALTVCPPGILDAL